MTRRDRAWIAAMVAACLALGALVLFRERLPEPVPNYAPTWERDEAPAGEPIIGFWIEDSQPVPLACVRYGGIYYEYRPGTPYPAPLYGYAPVWWIEMPGGAE